MKTNMDDHAPVVQMLTVHEAALALRVCDETVRRLIRRGRIPAIRVGTALRVRLDDLIATLAMGNAA